jgi:hypothetical protein
MVSIWSSRSEGSGEGLTHEGEDEQEEESAALVDRIGRHGVALQADRLGEERLRRLASRVSESI